MDFSDEKEREKLLKRFLSAFVILVGYFIFVKEGIDEEKAAAEQQYKSMAEKGISDEVLPALHKRKVEIATSVAKLDVEHKKVVTTHPPNKTRKHLTGFWDIK